jgi:1-acyl-sn-glycerol-3-phosphate acyltransferase
MWPIWSPSAVGLEHIPPSGPALLIGNHSHSLGVIDIFVMPILVHEATGRSPRGLGDHMHWQVPGWGRLLERYGAVRGTRDRLSALLDQGELVAIFPGGAREVAKRRGERYSLIWGDRLGFARAAIDAQVPIIPFASVGPDEMYDVVLDADSAPLRPWRWLVSRAMGGRTDFVLPFATGFLGTPLPKPVRFRFAFQPPIAPPPPDSGDQGAAALRDEVQASIRAAIADLRQPPSPQESHP